MSSRTLTAVAVAMFTAVPPSAQQRDLSPYLISDRAAEVSLARTAAPKAISDSASVLVLTRTGYVQAAKGTSGFTCLVLRSFSAPVDDPDYWNSRVRSPVCFNQPAVRTVLPAMLSTAKWAMDGASAPEIATKTDRAYASHEFPLPATGAMGYMLSPIQHISDEDPHWVPHLMFYYDKSLPSAAWGVSKTSTTVLDAAPGDIHSPVLTLLIPVRRWSDGTQAIHGAGH